MSKVVKIVQIAPVVEYYDTGDEDRGTWKRIPNEEATIYGLGRNGRMYYWACLKSVKKENPDYNPEDYESEPYIYEKTYGWKLYEP